MHAVSGRDGGGERKRWRPRGDGDGAGRRGERQQRVQKASARVSPDSNYTSTTSRGAREYHFHEFWYSKSECQPQLETHAQNKQRTASLPKYQKFSLYESGVPCSR
eukprot:334693-Rhodomonas_salina.1